MHCAGRSIWPSHPARKTYTRLGFLWRIFHPNKRAIVLISLTGLREPRWSHWHPDKIHASRKVAASRELLTIYFRAVLQVDVSCGSEATQKVLLTAKFLTNFKCGWRDQPGHGRQFAVAVETERTQEQTWQRFSETLSMFSFVQQFYSIVLEFCLQGFTACFCRFSTQCQIRQRRWGYPEAGMPHQPIAVYWWTSEWP